MDIVYVVWWKYSDGSNSNIIGVYKDRDKAEAQIKILDRCGDISREYILTEAPYTD